MVVASLTSVPALARGSVYRKVGWDSGRLRYNCAWYVPCGCGCSGQFGIYYYQPARNYAAAYYNSRGGVGRGYSTTAYSRSGYPHPYAK
jgi:hypothetical protein